MKQAAHSISIQRLDRLMLWSRLWLLKFASFILQTTALFAPLERAAGEILKPRLETLAKIILLLISLKASRLIQTPVLQKRYAPGKSAPALMRRVFGSRLRRLTSARDPGAQIAALLSLLESAETEIARLVKRLRAGLTRRRGGFKPEARVESLGRYYATPLDCADTS
jgi:hypothetical protein